MMKRLAAPAIIICISLLEFLGYVFDLPSLTGLGFLSASSPIPLVFTDRGGFEDFATQTRVKFHFSDGTELEKALTASEVAELDGPFQLRYPVIASFGYGPILPEPLIQSIQKKVLCEKTDFLKKHFGTTSDPSSIEISFESRNSNRPYHWSRTQWCR